MDILPFSYNNAPTVPQVLGNAGDLGVILQMEQAGDSSQVLLDKNLPTVTTVKVTGYSDAGSIDPEGISFHYSPAGKHSGVTVPVRVLGQPELQEDGSYLVTTEIPALGHAIDGHLLASYLDGAVSDGLGIAQAPYPEVLDVLEGGNVNREIISDYENLLDVLAPPNARSNTGTVQSEFSYKGLNPLEHKDDIKQKGAVHGATQQAVSRLRGLSELLSIHHLGDEFAKLQAWAGAIAIFDLTSANIIRTLADEASLLEYVAGVTQDVIKLTTILEQYSINLKGATVSQNSSVVNHAAQAFRYTSNSVFDIESPTTLLNTEYLIQQASRGSYRQTGVDQVSCFDSWHRAEDNMVRQSKAMYNYATEKIYNGAMVEMGTYGSVNNYCTNNYHVQAGISEDKSSFTVTSQDSIDLFSAAGSFFVRTLKSIIKRTSDFIVTAKESIFIVSDNRVAIQSENDLHLISAKGRIVIDADSVVFRTTRPPEFYVGPGNQPVFNFWTVPAVPFVERPDLMQIPTLLLFDSNDLADMETSEPIDSVEEGEGTSIEVIAPEGTPIEVIEPEEEEPEEDVRPPLYFVEGDIITAPTFNPVILPSELLDYPKAPTAPVVPQPNNEVVFTPVYPAG